MARSSTFSLKENSYRHNIALITIICVFIVVIITFLKNLAGWWIEYQWFSTTNYIDVYKKTLIVHWTSFLVIFFCFSVVFLINNWLAYRCKDVQRIEYTEHALGVYRQFIAKNIRKFWILPSVFIALFIALVERNSWKTYLIWKNSTPFGIKDPQFSLDIGFYCFSLPFYRLIVTLATIMVIFAIIFSLIIGYLYGSIELQSKKLLNSKIRLLLTCWFILFLLIKAVSYWLDRYELLFSRHKALVNGATYTTVNALIPAKIIMASFCIICAVIFIGCLFLKDMRLAGLATVIMFISSVIFTVIWPSAIEQFSVKPNEVTKENEYIIRNIIATEQAFGLSRIESGGLVRIVPNWPRESASREGTVTSTQSSKDDGNVDVDTATADNIRIIDPDIVSAAFSASKGERTYYSFPRTLDVDRYTINGKLTSFIVAVRELNPNQLGREDQNWNNKHLVFTHGSGFYAVNASSVNIAPSETTEQIGDLLFYTPKDEQDPLYVENPRIYFGEIIGSDKHDDYAIVGGSGPNVEWDFPRDRYRYEGKGIPLDSWLLRSAFALKNNEWNFLLSKEISHNSSVLLTRDPRERVHALAPWLTIDPDTYPVIVNHKVLWVVDGYSILHNYPYAQQQDSSILTQSNPKLKDDLPINRHTIGYIRNSVKATVDAYTGEVNLYQTDTHDPVLSTWMKIYPGLIKPNNQIPLKLKEHLRYPLELFRLQRYLMQTYHGSGPADFFQRADLWSLPKDPQNGDQQPESSPQSPYYVIAADPRTGNPSFQISSVLLSGEGKNIVAALSVSNDPQTYGLFTLRELKATNAKNFPSPALALTKALQTAINTDKHIIASTVKPIYGTALSLALTNGNILYVEPIYLQSTPNSTLSLYRVLVTSTHKTGQLIGYGTTAESALKQMGISELQVPDIPSQPPHGHLDSKDILARLAVAGERIRQAIAGLREAKKTGSINDFFKYSALLDAAIQQWQQIYADSSHDRSKQITSRKSSP